jgi:hypothetical protein
MITRVWFQLMWTKTRSSRASRTFTSSTYLLLSFSSHAHCQRETLPNIRTSIHASLREYISSPFAPSFALVYERHLLAILTSFIRWDCVSKPTMPVRYSSNHHVLVKLCLATYKKNPPGSISEKYVQQIHFLRR